MDEYLYKTHLQLEIGLDEEEIIYMVANEKVHTNRKKKYHKEKFNNGEESDYDFYC
jgi:hypothetical protein